MAEIDEAVAVTGATSGKVVGVARGSTVVTLTGAQKTALANFITSLGASVWPGSPGHVTQLTISRMPPSGLNGTSTGQFAVVVNGYLVYADAATAVQKRSSGEAAELIGAVP